MQLIPEGVQAWDVLKLAFASATMAAPPIGMVVKVWVDRRIAQLAPGKVSVSDKFTDHDRQLAALAKLSDHTAEELRLESQRLDHHQERTAELVVAPLREISAAMLRMDDKVGRLSEAQAASEARTAEALKGLGRSVDELRDRMNKM